MQNIKRFILTFFIAIPLVFGFGSQTVKQIDEIKNNTGTDILLNPTDKVDINYFTGEKALQSTVDGELEESAVTNTELSYVSGVTSSIQTQINAKQDTLTGTDGDLYYWNSGLANLGIGSQDQVLTVSALGFPEWADLPPSVSVTTKGDLQTYSTAPDRLPVGTDGQVLQANSATSTGLEWIDPNFYTSPLTTQGDILYRDATQDTRLGIGTEGQLLTVTSGEPAWQDAPVTLPSQTGNEGLYLTTDGSNASWNEINDDVNEIKNNFLECSGFDGCTQEGTITNGAGVDASSIVSRTTETTAFNPSKLNLSQSLAGTLDYTYTKTASFSNKQLVAYCEIKTANTGVTFSAGADSVEAGSLEVSSNDSWKYYKIPLVGGATDQYFKIDHSDAGTIPDIDVDNCFIGKSPDTIKELGQASFVGQIDLSNNCRYQRDNTSYGIALDSDSTCSATSTIGSVSLPTNTNQSGVKIQNFRTDGYYKVKYQGLLYNASNTNVCYFSLSKDANYSGQGEVFVNNGSGGSREQNTVDGTFRFDNSDSGEVYLISKNNASTTCALYAESGNPSAVTVYFYPDDNSTVVTQDTELTAKTDNHFTAFVSSTEVVSGENHNWISSCVESGNNTRCLFNSGIFTVAPVCNTDAGIIQSISSDCRAVTTTSTYVDVACRTNTSNPVLNEEFDINCTKSGVDYNKSATIVGKFENINSSDLIQVIVRTSGTQTLAAGTNVIQLNTEEKDTHNAFDTSTYTFTSPETTCYAVSGLVRFAAGTAVNMFSSLLGTVSQVTGKNGTRGVDSSNFASVVSVSPLCMNEGETLQLSGYTSAAVGRNTEANSGLTITELPDTESIIKNLSQQKTECQTKYLQANATTSGFMSDLQFNNLTIGKKYSVTLATRQVFSSNFQAAEIVHSGATLLQVGGQFDTTGNQDRAYQVGHKPMFTATSTTIQSYAGVQTGGYFEGSISNLDNFTNVTLCELPDTYVETNKF